MPGTDSSRGDETLKYSFKFGYTYFGFALATVFWLAIWTSEHDEIRKCDGGPLTDRRNGWNTHVHELMETTKIICKLKMISYFMVNKEMG